MFASTPVGTVDELEVGRLSSNNGGGDDGAMYYDDTDDATEFSQRSLVQQPYGNGGEVSGVGAGRSIRMEGWLNHITSRHKNQTTTSTALVSDGASVAPTVVTTASSSGGGGIIRRSKKKAKRNNRQPRYFVLRGSTLSYYARRHDVKSKGTFVLTRGCEVGHILHGSLDESLDKATTVTAEQAHQLQVDNPLSPASSSGGNYDYDTDAANNKSSSKKKKRQYYLVQITWPIDTRPSKDEQVMAQAKAQVAAESENEAIVQQRQLEQLHESEYLDDSGGGLNNSGNKSPTMRPKIMRRSKSDSKSPRKTSKHLSSNDDSFIPPDLAQPSLTEDDNDQNDNAPNEQLRPASLIPSNKAAINTPASTLAGVNAFHLKTSTAETDNQGVGEATTTNPSGYRNHETGLHKHYTQQLQKSLTDQRKSEAELAKVMALISKKSSHAKTKKKVIQGTKVAAVSTAAITAGVLTAGIGLAAGLVFVGITAAAGGSGAVVGSKMLDKARGKYHQHQKQKSFHLVIGATTYDEAIRWKKAMETVIKELVMEAEGGIDGDEIDWRIKQTLSGGGDDAMPDSAPRVGDASSVAAVAAPLSPKRRITIQGDMPLSPVHNGSVGSIIENAYDSTPKWAPIQGGMALWGILGALGGGGGNFRIYREERSHIICSSPSTPYWLFSQPSTSPFPRIPRFRSDVGLVGQPFPPLKASMTLKANSLDAFMCLMCSGRIQDDEDYNTASGKIPMPNSGQIASFLIIETMDDHMDVIHLVFRPLYLFPSWTVPRDFVLYRFWKYDDDGTYQICFDSGEHRDCPPVPGYVRGQMHSVYTIAPLKQKKKRGAPTGAATGPGGSSASTGGSAQSHTGATRPNLMNEECLLSHVVQIDPRGWVPSTSSLPFFRNQGYGDAFAIMALHQMLDVKEALDSARFVAVPMDNAQNTFSGSTSKEVKRVQAGVPKPGKPRRSRSGGNRQRQQLYVPTLEVTGSCDIYDEEEPDSADYDFKYSGREMLSPTAMQSSSEAPKNVTTSVDSIKSEAGMAPASSIGSIPPPMM